MQNPYLSVVVIAHDRKKYILDALTSLAKQDIDKREFEIIIVKNYSDPSIDAMISRFNAKNIIIDAQTLGEKLQIGIENCAGRVISFLEDDDLFEPTKLTAVKRYFETDKNLSYYHNAFSTVNDSNNVVRRRYRGRIRGFISLTNGSTRRKLTKFWVFNPDFNLSCISILKSLILPHRQLLKGMHTGIDSLMLFVALTSGSSLIADSNKLTRFRIHNGSITHKLDNFESFVSSTKGYFEKQKLALRNISTLIMNNAVSKHYSCFVSEMDIGEGLMNGNSPSRAMYSSFLVSAKCAIYHRGGFHSFYTVLGFLGAIAPKLSRYAFFVIWKLYLGEI